MSWWTIITALGANALLATGALSRRAVTRGGAAAGFLTGTIIYLGGGLFFWLILGAFFTSSSLLSRLGGGKKKMLDRLHQKGSRRDAVQVLANGGIGAVMALMYIFTPTEAVAVAFIASFAAATADTWASELGVLSSSAPRSILTLKPLPTGASGGVSLIGTLAAAAGAGFIALAAAGWLQLSGMAADYETLFLLRLMLIVAATGVTGSFIDSLLGAGLQARYRASDGTITERSEEDGDTNSLVSGLVWMNNDMVNLLSISGATGLAWLLAGL